MLGQLLIQLSRRRELSHVAQVAIPLLSNRLRNLLESTSLVAVLVPSLSSMAAVSKAFTTLPRNSDRSDAEVGEHHQSHTLRFGNCLQRGKA